LPEVYKLAEQMANSAPLAMKFIKGVLNRNCHEDWSWACMMMPTVFATEDVAEARQAFSEKRKPEYKGK
jgi:enoyl-CoA hydratase